MLIISPGLIARRCLIEFRLEYCRAGSIEPTQREGLAVQRTARANTARFRGFHLTADPYRRPQRGPVTDVNLPRGLRGRRVS
jgi:hypothetical protein